MTLPILGPISLSGFAHAWWFLFLFVVAALVVLGLGTRRLTGADTR